MIFPQFDFSLKDYFHADLNMQSFFEDRLDST